MEDNVIIYVAGNPEAYPLEYYDKESETYQGVIPRLLAQFSAQSGYELVYYPTDGTDRREHMAKNVQVDILSGYQVGEELPNCVDQVILFRTKTDDGQEQEYQLCLTKAAPPQLKGDLESFLQGVTQEEITGLLMEVHTQPQNHSGLYWVIGGLALALILVTVLLLVLLRRNRKRLHRAEQNVETDEGTGLGNADYLMRYYGQIVNDKNRVLYALVYLDLDTERLRRLGGEQETRDCLRYCAMTLQEYAGDTDLLARVSDRGFVLLKLAANENLLQEQVGQILKRLRSYPQTYGKSFELTAAAGIYFLRSEDRDMNEMIFSASQAAHRAEERQLDYVVFDRDMKQTIAEERSLQNSVNHALESRQFQLYVQFYVDAQHFRVIGGEALSRWNHPQKGILGPGQFVPLLERERLIYKLDYYCLNEVCRFLEALKGEGVEQFFVSCNFSRETFASENFVCRCKEIMDRYTFPRELLIFELTESVAESHSTQIKHNMVDLKQYGVSIALDDFGEGFTSFDDLLEYPVDGIKLDQCLVKSCGTRQGMAILRAVVQAGHELGITILAEGVEQEEEICAMQELHCDVIQGFRFHRPIPAWEARDQLLKQFFGKNGDKTL